MDRWHALTQALMCQCRHRQYYKDVVLSRGLGNLDEAKLWQRLAANDHAEMALWLRMLEA